MRDANRFKEKVELSLDSRQIFFLLFGGAAAACLVFVMGIIVGKRLEGRRLERGIKCRDQLARLDRLAGKKDRFTFHKVLVKKSTNPNLPPEVAETADFSEHGSEVGGTGRPDPFGFRTPQQHLAAPSAQTTGMQPGQGAGTQPTQAAPMQPGQGTGVPSAPHQAGRVAARVPARRQVRRGAVVRAGSRAGSNLPSGAAVHPNNRTRSGTAGGPAGGAQTAGARTAGARTAGAPAAGRPSVRRYTLQVSSFQARSEAESMMRQLESSGLRPYLISSYIPRRGMWYRIRVGDFSSRTKAKLAKKEFERRWRMTAYVTRMN